MTVRTQYLKLENGDIIAVYKADVVKPKEKRVHERNVTLRCLRDLLDMDDVELCRTGAGAPYIEGFDGDISLSHSGPWYAFHIAKDHNAGIDVQVIKKR